MFPEPSFVHMEFVGESFESQDGDDDKIYLFFSENAKEYDFYSQVVVSRVARVCKVRFRTTLLSASGLHKPHSECIAMHFAQ